MSKLRNETGSVSGNGVGGRIHERLRPANYDDLSKSIEARLEDVQSALEVPDTIEHLLVDFRNEGFADAAVEPLLSTIRNIETWPIDAAGRQAVGTQFDQLMMFTVKPAANSALLESMGDDIERFIDSQNAAAAAVAAEREVDEILASSTSSVIETAPPAEPFAEVQPDDVVAPVVPLGEFDGTKLDTPLMTATEFAAGYTAKTVLYQQLDGSFRNAESVLKDKDGNVVQRRRWRVMDSVLNMMRSNDWLRMLMADWDALWTSPVLKAKRAGALDAGVGLGSIVGSPFYLLGMISAGAGVVVHGLTATVVVTVNFLSDLIIVGGLMAGSGLLWLITAIAKMTADGCKAAYDWLFNRGREIEEQVTNPAPKVPASSAAAAAAA